MRILLAVTNLYRDAVGLESFYTALIAGYPEHSFWFFAEGESNRGEHPANAHTLQVADLYRSHGANIRLPAEALAAEDMTIAGREGDLLFLMDLAESVAGCEFDVVDIPHTLPLGGLLPFVLSRTGVAFDRTVMSLCDETAAVSGDRWDTSGLPGSWTPDPHEIAFFRSADARYGISERSLSTWTQATGPSARCVDFGSTIDLDFFRTLRASGSHRSGRLPRPVFAGPQQKATGADLFIELAGGVPLSAHDGALILGLSAHEELSRMAKRRRMTLDIAARSRDEMLQGFAGEGWIGLFPSRAAGFSRLAVEALLCGAPAALSSRDDACAFLDLALPGIPFIRLDLTDLVASQAQVTDLVRGYESEHERLLCYLENAELQPAGDRLDAVCAAEPTPDQTVRQSLSRLAEQATEAIETRVASLVKDALRQRMTIHLSENAALPGATAFSAPRIATPDKLATMFDQSLRVDDIVERVTQQMTSTGPLDNAKLAVLSKQLTPLCYGANRIALYRLLAEIEGRRGNELLSATYQLRTLRLSGVHDEPALDATCDILTRHNFAEEAGAARMLYGRNQDVAGTLGYLRARREQFRAPPPEVGTQILDRRTPETPKISIVVSLYNAARKLPIFLRGITQLTEATRRATELIFIDSNSPDETREAMQSLLDGAAPQISPPLSVLYVRTAERETIQRAWNRGIALARGSYLALLGVDEAVRPDAFDILADHLDRHPDVDWAQGSALVTEVDAIGSFRRDVMPYNRNFDSQTMHYLDVCYIGYVGSLYRRSIHDRVGFYDDRFRAAGDVEFKNRALPEIRVVTLPHCLGFFHNYPDERTTESPTAELEDLRAWYLHRSFAGVTYAFGGKEAAEAAELFRRCLSYRKSYMELNCTDLELAATLGRYLSSRRSPDGDRLTPFFKTAERARDLYRTIDGVGLTPRQARSLAVLQDRAKIVVATGKELAATAPKLAALGIPIELDVQNDNRFHQHSMVWDKGLQAPAGEVVRTPELWKRGTSFVGAWIGGKKRAAKRWAATGDQARDRRDWHAAAAAYRRALAADPSRWEIWVQQGHALKESGDRSGAEAAYRRSLSIAAEVADTHLQLGHVFKLDGRLTEAAEAYLTSLTLDPEVSDGRRELEGLGYGSAEIDKALAMGWLSKPADASHRACPIGNGRSGFAGNGSA